MLKEVLLGKIGLTMDKGTIVSWIKREGEYVEKGEPLFEVETDKDTQTIESYHAGYLKKIVVQAGQEAPLRTVIAYIGEKDDQVPEKFSGASEIFGWQPALESEVEVPPPQAVKVSGGRTPQTVRSIGKKSSEVVGSLEGRQAEGVPREKPFPETFSSGKINASPIAKRLAEELGMDISLVKGTGPEERIGKEDVIRAKEELERKRSKLVLEAVPLKARTETIVPAPDANASAGPYGIKIASEKNSQT